MKIKKKIIVFFTVLILPAIVQLMIPTIAQAATWEGWNETNQKDAWDVFDMTDWTEFEALGCAPPIFLEETTKATVSDNVRDLQETIKQKLKSYTGGETSVEAKGYSGYTELMLAIAEERTEGKEEDVFNIAALPGYEGKTYTKEESIATACELLVKCVDKSENVTPFKNDATLKAVIVAWYLNDPDIIGFFTEQKYSQEQLKAYKEQQYEALEDTTVDHDTFVNIDRYTKAIKFIDTIYHCNTVQMYGDYSGNVAAGLAGTINDSERLRWLFPNGTPTSSSQMSQYLTTITVRINTPNGISSMNLQVHKNLANEIVSIFEDLLTIKGFYVDPGDTYGYGWRLMASGTGKISHHSYGCVIDLNAGANPAVYWGYSPDKSSPYYANPFVVAVFKKHGFYWGGDWSAKYYDPMHFTYTNH